MEIEKEEEEESQKDAINEKIEEFGKDDAKAEESMQDKIKYASDKVKPKEDPTENENTQETFIDDIIITITLLLPRLTRQNTKASQKMAQFEFRGSQPLSDLSDVFFCPTDAIQVARSADIKGKKPVPSSFLFVEKTFYVDDRTPQQFDDSRYFLHLTLGNIQLMAGNSTV